MKIINLSFSIITLGLTLSCWATPDTDLQAGLYALDAQLIQQAVQAGAKLDSWQGRWDQPVLAGLRAQVKQLGAADAWSIAQVHLISESFSKLQATLLVLRQCGIRFDWEVNQQMSFQDRWNLQFPFLRDQIQQYQEQIKLLPAEHQLLAEKLIAQMTTLHTVINGR